MSLVHEGSVLPYTCNIYMTEFQVLKILRIYLIPVKLDRSLHWIPVGAGKGPQQLKLTSSMAGEFCNPSLYQTMHITFSLTISAVDYPEL